MMVCASEASARKTDFIRTLPVISLSPHSGLDDELKKQNLETSLMSEHPMNYFSVIRSGLIALAACAAAQADNTVSAPVNPASVSAHSMHGMSNAQRAPAPAAIPAADSGAFITGRVFANPPIISSSAGTLEISLTAKAAPVTISGKRVNARVYGVSANGKSYPPAFMPPTLVVNPGDNLKVNLVNELGEPTNLHQHGFFVSPSGNADNIFVDLSSGKSFFYNYQLPSDIATGSYWYHPHYHPLVEEQVFGGLSGFIYVRGIENKLPPQLQGITQQFVGLKDFQLDANNSIPAANIDSGAPTNRTINGQIQPVMRMRPGETQLWHIGNLGADIWYNLELAGFTFMVIAEDANPVDQTWSTKTLMMPPAKRFDVLVQAPAAGSFQLITRNMNTGPDGDHYPATLLATVKVQGAAMAPAGLPAHIEPFDDLSKAVIARKRIFDLSENPTTNQFYINQREFNANQVDATPVTGTVEEWVFKNSSRELHPIHMHVNDAHVVSINGVMQARKSLQDTIPIPYATYDDKGNLIPGEVVMRIRFREFVGPYVYHCHILAHEDNGMMTIVNVTSPDSE